MLVLLDHGTPGGLARALSGHTVHTAQAKGWTQAHRPHGASQGLDTLSNGELLNAAEKAGFELLLTTDRHIRYQQNLRVRRIALVVLPVWISRVGKCAALPLWPQAAEAYATTGG